MNTFQHQSATPRFNAWYPWLVWAMSSLFMFYKYLLQVSPSVMVPDLMRTFALSGAGLGHLAAFYFYAYLIMQLPVGLLLDTFDPRRMVSLAILTCAIGAGLFAYAESFWVAALGRVLIGLGGAFSAVGTMKLITVWFPPQQFALVAGLMMTLGMLGAVGGQAPIAMMVDNMGWRQTIVTTSLLGFVFAGLFYAVIRMPAGFTRESSSNFLLCIKTIISNPQSWLISVYSGLAFAPVSTFAGLWGIPFLMEKMSLPRDTVAAVVSLAFIGFAIGAPLSGWLSDKLMRRKPIMFIGTSLTFLIVLAILYLPIHSSVIMTALMFSFGFFCSWFFVSFATMREHHPILFAGTAIGFINMFNALFEAISEPLVGSLLDWHWQGQVMQGIRHFSSLDFQIGLSILPLELVLSLLVMLWIRETHCTHQQ